MSKSDLDIFINLIANTKGMRGEYQQAAAKQVALNREMNRGKQAAATAASGLNQVERQSSLLNTSLRSVAGTAATVFGVLSARTAAIDIKDTLADYQQFSTRLRFLSEDTQDYTSTMAFLDNLADEHGKTILSLGESYTSLAALRKGDLLTMQQSRDLLTGLSNAQSALGVESSKLELVLYGLGQAMSQPVVQTAEFNQVVEPLPGLMQAMTRAAGLQSGSFRDLVLSGKVTSDMLRDILIKALKEYDGAAKANIDNITAQEDALENLRVKTIAAFEDPINNAYGAMLDTAASSLEFFKDNAQSVTTALEVLTVAGLLRGTAALVNYTTATVAKRTATIEAARADLLQAQSNVNVARTQAGVTGMYGASTAAATRLKVATDTLTAAQARYNAVAITGTAVGRGLLAVMGGIPGVVLLGGYALYSWATSADDATAKAKGLTDQVEALNSAMNPFSKYTKTQATSALQRYTGQMKLAEQMAQEMRERFDNPYFDVTIEQVVEAEKAVEDLANKIALLNQVLKRPTDTSGPVDNAAIEKSKTLLANLEKQAALYGTVGEAAKIAYETAYGSLKNLSAEEKAQVILAATKLDAKKSEIDQARQLKDETDLLISQRQREIALFGNTTHEAKIRYDLEHGSLVAINEEIRKKLILQAQELDKLNEAKRVQAEVERIAAGAQTPTQRENANYKSNIGTLETYRDSLPEQDLAKRQEINQLIEMEQLRHNRALEDIARNSKSEIDAMWSETFDRFAAGIGNATADALFESKNLGDGIRSVLLSTGKQAVATLVEIGIKRAALAAINTASTTTEATTSATAMTTAAGTITGAMAPAAAATTLATGGTNGIGSLATIAAVGAAMSAMFAGLFDKGGNISAGKFGIVGERGHELVQGPAYVTSRQQTEKMFQQSGNKNGATNITYIDNSQFNVTGANTEEVISQIKPMFAQSKRDTVAEVGRQLSKGRGPVYDGYRVASA
ncbi:tape measure protein [uncultured Alteromonas sp.]|uniref:tape measure protein n=1 Tax=uncultured Alteromonas sp. TaxID=179113 RepID=UPI0025F9B1CE|nr:tape measure protein [uncultured Alteromonas sp.]